VIYGCLLDNLSSRSEYPTQIRLNGDSDKTLIGVYDSMAGLLIWQNVAILTDFTVGHYIKSSTRIKVVLESNHALNVTLIDLSRGMDEAVKACITTMSTAGELGKYCLYIHSACCSLV
jgi:hypothetical protein